MTANADVLVYSRDRRLALAVETTGIGAPSAEAAIAFRCSLLEHQLLPKAPFFLLVTPTTMFLWRDETPPNAPADFSVSADTVLKNFGRLEDGKRVMSKGELEIAVLHWVGLIACGLRELDSASPLGQMFIQSGLYEEILHGEVRFDTGP